MEDQEEPHGPSVEARAAPDRRLGFLFYRIGHAIGRAFEDALQSYGIGPAHFGVLNALDAYGVMHQQQLVRLLGINRQTIVNVANELEGRGLIERRADEHDKRVFILHMTAAGRDFLSTVDANAVAIEQGIFDLFTPAEREQLYRWLYQLATSGKFGALFEIERIPKSTYSEIS
jgi:DNA-binding MarR family transcriptional regulator